MVTRFCTIQSPCGAPNGHIITLFTMDDEEMLGDRPLPKETGLDEGENELGEDENKEDDFPLTEDDEEDMG